ncbi:serine-rich coiled-coil domain-containing protein 1 isoform X2 [Hyperolius riggenbachi]
MGDVGTRRSTLVSRLPIFRRSISRKQQDSLPSSPSSNNTGGLHSSSPSSTNSSSGSTGKRRSIFRTPSLSFRHKKENDLRYETSQVTNTSQSMQDTSQKQEFEEQVRTKTRSSSGIPSSCRKKLTRSVTEDFEKRKEHSANKNVFTNCLGRTDGDDSGFIEEPTRRSTKHSSRKLLPRSFSSHYRFSKHSSQSQTPSSAQTLGCPAEVPPHLETDSLVANPILHSATEVTELTENSLQSPLISTDHTTAPQTPSDFVFMDDSTSEADSLPISIHQKHNKQHITYSVPTSQTSGSPVMVVAQVNKDLHIVEEASECDGLSLSRPQTDTSVKSSNTSHTYSKEMIPLAELSLSHTCIFGNGSEKQHRDMPVYQDAAHINSIESLPKRYQPAVSYCENIPFSSTCQTLPETGVAVTSLERQSSRIQNGHSRVNYSSSFSPFRDGRYSERRLRSSSEGTAGGGRMAFKPKEQHSEELAHFRKQRTISTSSKMSSMDVLNNLGSCELDEDDLMLDLEFTEEQNLRRVCREDSYQSIVSCSAVVLSHVEQQSNESNKTTEEEQPKMSETSKRNLYLHLPRESDHEDSKCPHVCQVPTSPSVEWPFPQEDISGLESLPYRLMMQDCTSVKTLLLKMKRILQESTEMSPASSTASLPISPTAERNYPFKDIMKDECSMLKLQLKERDELIHLLQEELKAARTLQSLTFSKQDKYTQTEFVNHEVTNNVQRNAASTEGSIYKTIRPVHCFQHYQFKPNIWTQDALH